MSDERTHLVTRISTAPAAPFRVFFNAIGRSLEWNAADAADSPGSPQEVSAAVAAAIESDESLAPHFRCEPIVPAAAAPEESRPSRRRPTE